MHATTCPTQNGQPPRTTPSEPELTALSSASLAAADVPVTALLAPWGTVETANGRFEVDDESARLVVEAFARHGTDLPIDYEHQTLGGSYASPNGQAPAAGWITSVEAQPGVGLVAHITWTDPAVEQLRNRQYRYLSPVALIRRKDRKMIGLHSAALTNKPAIVRMEPLINRAAAPDAPLSKLRAQLDLPEQADAEQVLLAATDRIEGETRAQRESNAAARVAEAMAEGRLTEAQRDWAIALILRDESLFDDWLASAPVVVMPGSLTPPMPATSGGSSLRRNAADRARAKFRSNRLLSRLTSEEAFIADAVREADAPPAN